MPRQVICHFSHYDHDILMYEHRGDGLLTKGERRRQHDIRTSLLARSLGQKREEDPLFFVALASNLLGSDCVAGWELKKRPSFFALCFSFVLRPSSTQNGRDFARQVKVISGKNEIKGKDGCFEMMCSLGL